MKRLCYKCFSELPENANYCPNCGEPMRAENSQKRTKKLRENKYKVKETGNVSDQAVRVGMEERYETADSKLQIIPPHRTEQKRQDLNEAISRFAEIQRNEVQKEEKKRRFRVCVDPDTVIGKEIMYQTALLKELLHKIRTLQNSAGVVINTQEVARAVRGVCNEEKEKEGEPDEL